MHQGRLCGIALLTVLLAANGCTETDDAPVPINTGSVTLTVAPAKATYSAGEQVTLNIELTNTHDEQCRLSKTPQGSLTILSLTNDGDPVVPASGTAHFYIAFDTTLTANLVGVPPDTSLGMSLTSETDPATGNGNAFVIYSADSRGGASLAAWPIGDPGHYRLTASYLRPPLRDVPVDACSAAAEQAAAEFTVGAP